MIAVTDASGELGSLVIEGLLKKVAPDRLVAIVRRPERAAHLVARGIRVRPGGYSSSETLGFVLTGVKRLLLISGNDLSQQQHRAVIDGAKAAGVQLIVYASLLQLGSSTLPIATEHTKTEELIRRSGIPFVMLRKGWCAEDYTENLGVPLAPGAFLGAVRDGRIAAAAPTDFAAAAVAVLTTDGHDGKTYELAGDQAFTLAEFAHEVSRLAGKSIAYDRPAPDYRKALADAGLSNRVIDHPVATDLATAQGGRYSRSRDRSLRIVHSEGDVTWDQAGRPLRQFGVVQDLTAGQTEQHLRASEARFRTFVDHATDAFFLLDDRSIVIDANRQACAGLGYAREELIGKHRRDFDPSLDDTAVQALKHRILAGETVTFETRHRRKDGTTFPVEVRVGHFEEGGHRYLCVARDVSERKCAEEALRRSEAYLAEAQKHSNSGAFAFDEERSLYWSEQLYRIWGFDPLAGIPTRDQLLQRVHPGDRDRTYEALQRTLRQKQDCAIEYRIVLPDGTLKHLRSICRPSYSACGEFLEVVGTTIDVTERKRAQDEHERVRRLEADLAHLNRVSIMGELSASLAHEILHPISAVAINANAALNWLSLTSPDVEEARISIEQIIKDAHRSSEVIARARALVKKAPRRNERFDFNEAIREVTVLTQSEALKNEVSVKMQLADGLLLIEGDRVQLQQVLLNLVINAIQAMATTSDGARDLLITTAPTESSFVLVGVADSGPGVDPQMLEQVFDPYCTTKSEGLGMGLAICRSIIGAHDGRLWANANHPRGAVFQFTLPAEPGGGL